MKQKLHRGRRSVFRRRSPILQITPAILSVLGVVAVIAVGFFGAKYLSENPPANTPTSEPSSGVPAVSQPEEAAPEIALPAEGTPLHAFYLPTAALRDQSALKETLAEAAEAGLNAVVFDMKDENGTLYFRSATERAVRVNNFANSALSADQLKTLFITIKEAGLQSIPRLFAFRDNAAARVLEDARVKPTGNASWVWYDNDPKNGGKAWLDPYADAAHLYIIDLARELRDAGASAILLDGVQFPFQTSGADFSAETTSGQSRKDKLTAFVTEAKQLLGEDCPVLLSCTGDSALGENTKVYGANPLTFGADTVAPVVTVGEELNTHVRQMVARIKLLGTAQPQLAPLLTVENIPGAELKALMTACQESGTEAYILYADNGEYPFSALS